MIMPAMRMRLGPLQNMVYFSIIKKEKRYVIYECNDSGLMKTIPDILIIFSCTISKSFCLTQKISDSSMGVPVSQLSIKCNCTCSSITEGIKEIPFSL